MKLQIYYYNPPTSIFVPISENGEDKIIPCVQDENGNALLQLMAKNVSTDILSSINVEFSDNGDDVMDFAALKNGQFYSPNISSNIGGSELYPGQSFNIFAFPTSKVLEFHLSNLNISYKCSKVPSISTCVSYLEFTEDKGETTLMNSVTNPNISATATGEVIRGVGKAHFYDKSDKVELISYVGKSVFIKVRLRESETESPILVSDPVTLKLGTDRKLYLNDLTSSKTFLDTKSTHVIGLSMDSLSSAILTFDGSIVKWENPSGVLTPLSITISNLGSDDTNSMSGELSEFILFSDYKDVSFHKYIAEHI